MKKYLNIFLLITIFLNTSGYVLIYKKQQYDIKKEMFRKISTIIDLRLLTKLKLSKTSLPEWKDENEIKFNGSLYDIVKKEDKGSYVILYCINDQKEENVLKNFSKHFDDQNKNSSSKRTIAVFSFNAVVNFIYTLHKESVFSENIIANKDCYKSIIKNITSPPPKFSFV